MRYTLMVILLLILPFAAASDIGVSPSKIIKHNLLRDSSLEETIILSRSSGENISITTTVTGEASGWITYPADILFSEEDRLIRHPLKITVPKDADLGKYTATVDYFILGKDNLHMAFSIPISLQITDEEDMSYTIKHIKSKQENSSIIISFEVYNKGNVYSGPISASIEISNNGDKQVVYEGEGAIDKVRPFSIEERHAVFDAKISPGNYWINVNLEGNGQQYNEKIFFEADKNIVYNTERTKGPGYLLLIPLIGLILVIIFIITIKKR